MKLNDLLPPLLVTDLTVDGQALARLEGQVVFLNAGLPGELLSAKITRVKARYLQAERVETLTPSPYEICAPCIFFPKCGACVWQNLSLTAQHSWKAKHFLEVMRRFCKIECPITRFVASPRPFHFRNKISLAFGVTEQGPLILGTHQRTSPRLVAIEDCLLFSQPISSLLSFLRLFFAQQEIPAYNGLSGYLRFLVIRSPDLLLNGQKQMLVEVISASSGSKETAAYAKAIRQLGNTMIKQSQLGITGFVHSERKQKTDVAQGERIIFTAGTPYYYEEFNKIRYKASVSVFLQTNSALAAIMYELLLQELQLKGSEHIWDLYCGIGSIALQLAASGASVEGIDSQKQAIALAQENAALAGYSRCRFFHGQVGAESLQYFADPDIILLDPPRSGLEAGALKVIALSRAERLVYISCHCATQARDVLLLKDSWTPVKALLFDMFPHSPHLESMIFFKRNS